MCDPLDLTIAIPVKNEEQHLQTCLTSIGTDLAKKIVVIDSGSTDSTKKIVIANQVEIIDFTWNGRFPKKRNWYLRNFTPVTRWVMFLDADEYLTAEFKSELRTELQKNLFVGYWLSYSIHFMGKRLKGGYPLKKLALFQVGSGEYERIEEEDWSTLDMEIHEHPILSGKTGTLTQKIIHDDFQSVSAYVLKHNQYAEWEASRYLRVKAENKHMMKWTWKQKLKYRLMNSVWIGPAYFLGSFFLLGGFRDGTRGLAFAILKMSYFTQVYCKIREKESGTGN